MTTKDKEILLLLLFATIFFLIYRKIWAFTFNRWIWGTNISDHLYYLIVLIVVLPISYFSAKRLSIFFNKTD